MTAIALGLAATIAVLAFGGVTVLGFLLAQIIVLLAAGFQYMKSGWPATSRRCTLIFFALAAIPLLQLAPLPESVLALLSPGRSKLIHEFVLSGAGLQLAPSISLVPNETLLALLKFHCYLLVFVLAYQNADSRTGRHVLRRVLIGLGLIEAAYGLVQYLTGWQYIYNYAKTTSFANASGTYINYNHFAGLLEMVLPFLAIRLWMRPADGDSGRPSRSWKRILSSPEASVWMVRLSLFLVVFLGLIFSKSRSGIVSGIAGITVATLLLLPRGRRARALAAGLPIVGLLLAFSVWIGIAPVLGRFENIARQTEVDQVRGVIWRDTLSLIRDYPIFGSGLGTYPSVSLHYQTIPVTVRYDHAHNDYLEFAADIGIPAAIILFGGLWTLAIAVARKSTSLKRWGERQLAAACAGALVALLMHSLTDFNLQIPANALIFSWIAGTGAAIVRTGRQGRERNHAQVVTVSAHEVD